MRIAQAMMKSISKVLLTKEEMTDR